MDEELSVSVIGTVAAGVVAVACVELLRRRWATKQDVVGTAAPAGAAGPPDDMTAQVEGSCKPDTAWNRYFSRLDAVDRDATGPHKVLGRMIIRGMRHTEEEDSDEDADEDADEVQKKRDGYSDAELEYMRWVIITQRRADELEHMKEVVLGDDAHADFLVFNTSFSYEVMESFGELQDEYKNAKGWDAKLDKLFAYTHSIDEHDVWMHDHEVGWGGHRFIAALARLWKTVLRQSDVTLRVDSEFSRPGLVNMLERFKAKVEAIEQIDEPEIMFNFQ